MINRNINIRLKDIPQIKIENIKKFKKEIEEGRNVKGMNN